MSVDQEIEAQSADLPVDLDSGLSDELYQELRRRALAHLPRNQAQLSLQPTELVHEACLRMLKSSPEIRNRNHLLALAATIMRQVLIDQVRNRQASKRSSSARQITINITQIADSETPVDVLALDEALHQFEQISERAARIVELRFFAGLSRPEVAEVLDISQSTVERDWTAAKLWLRRKIEIEA